MPLVCLQNAAKYLAELNIYWQIFIYLARIICICHGRKSNLVEFQILPEESPVGVSTNINLVESPIGVSTGRKFSLEDWGIARESEI